MANLLEYLAWRGDLSLAESAFNEVDAVILARLSYLPYETVPACAEGRTVVLGAAAEALLATDALPEKDRQLLELLRLSRRFATLELFGYERRTDVPTQTQFAAVCFRLDEGTVCLCFRGTDNTLVGWKEDFNMTFVCPVPAQRLALAYLERIAAAEKGRLLLGGHSKGGNLAVYAAAFCDPAVQARIAQVYNFDGPGFDQIVLDYAGYDSICARIGTFVPQSSIVGMLLGHEEKYTVVQSTQKGGIFQHDVYSWQVDADGFQTLETVTNSSRFVDFTLKGWLAQMAPSEREAFIDTVYGVMEQTNATTLQELGEHRLTNTVALMRSLRGLAPEGRAAVIQALRLLLQSTKLGLRQMLLDR